MRVKAAVLAAIGAGLLAASVFLGIAASAVYAPASQVHALLANGQAGRVFANILLIILAVIVGLAGLALVAVAVGVLVRTRRPRRVTTEPQR